MSISLKDYFISKDLPESLKDDNVIDLAKVSDDFLHKIDALIERVLIYPNVDYLDEELINHLGFQQHIENFSTDLPLISKRELVKNSFLIHKLKGTRWAIETTLQQFFGNGETPEWFEYGGQPYFFKILHDVTDQEREYDRATIEYMKKVAFSVKNVRSWLDLIVFILKFEETIKPPDEQQLFEIFTHYADTIPYGRRGNSRYGHIQYGNFTYNRGINLDLDEVHLQMALEAADRYETLVRYGRIQYGQFKYGGKMALPLEDRPVINLSLLNAENIQTPIENTEISVDLTAEDEYKHSLKYGRFKYGDKAAYGSQKARPLEEVPKICITTEFEEDIEVDESFELSVIRPSHYGRIKYGKFQYGGEILCEDVM